jgi:WD40 repeat protein
LLDAAAGGVDATHTGHSTAVTSIAFEPGGKEVLSGDAEGQVRRWNLTGEGSKDTTARPSRSEVLRIGFFDDETVVALAVGLVASVDAKSRRVKSKLTVHADRVNAMEIVFPPDGARIFSGSHDGEIRVHDVKQKKEVLRFSASPGRNTRP